MLTDARIEMQMETWAEDIIEIADDASRDIIQKDGTEVVNHEHIARARLRVDTRKWLMSKLAAKKYGDRVTQQITGKDGRPIETREMSHLDMARRILWILDRAQPTTQ